MAITRHQKVFYYVWHWNQGPGWWRHIEYLDVGGVKKPFATQLAPLTPDVFGLIVQVQDDGKIPRDLADGWRGVGLRVDGMVGHVHDWEQNPEGLAVWMKAERNRLALAGWDCNFEDEVNGFDERSKGQWSVRFANELRRLHPTLPLYLDSYWGPMGDKINLGAYKARGFRFRVQTFWTEHPSGTPNGVWDDPPTSIVVKGAGAQPVIPKALIKPTYRVGKNNAGQFVDVQAAIADTKQADTKGCAFFPADAEGDFHTLVLMAKAALAGGIAYK